MNSVVKKSVAIFLTINMLFAFFPVSAFASDSDFTYIIENGEATINGYTGAGGSITIPSLLEDLPVTKIADSAFAGNAAILSVNFPQSITNIADHAFYNCASLNKVYFAGNRIQLGNEAFTGCATDFKLHYHISSKASWEGFSDHPAQAYCVLTKDLCDGTDPVASFEDINDGVITAPAEPERDGYDFGGWYVDSGYDTPWVNENIAGDIVIYAKWEPHGQTVTLNTMGGSDIDPLKAAYGTKITEPSRPQKAGYSFCGWYIDEGCLDAWHFDSDTVTDDITLYASWVSNGTSFTGSGTVDDPYGVSTPAQLNEVRNYLSSSFILLNDIDMTVATSEGGSYYNGGAGWSPIGSSSSVSFSGIFDGNKHKISGLKIIIKGIEGSNATIYAGLFGYLKGTVRGLGLESCIIKADNTNYCDLYTGGMAGYADNATIVQSYFTGEINCLNRWRNFGGGIAGYAKGTSISDCLAAGNIFCSNTTADYSGGICGYLDNSSITRCLNSGMANAFSGDAAVEGALAGGAINGTITNCFYYNTLQKSAYSIDAPSSAKSDQQLRQEATYSGFDFENTWTMSGNPDYPYAELKDMPFAIPSQNTSDFSGGRGTCYDPYRIETAQQLDNIRKFPGVFYIIQNDIDLSGFIGGGSWSPIGTFTGFLNGNGYKLLGLKINIVTDSSTSAYAGLFSQLYGTVDNLEIKSGSVYVKGYSSYAGAVAAYSSGGIISRCVNKVQVSAEKFTITSGSIYTGSIAGFATNGMFSKCSNSAAVSSSQDYAGGITGGCVRTMIDRCQNTGSVNSSNHTGGIAGYVSVKSSINDCFNTGSVYGYYAGGIADYLNNSSLSRCYNAGLVCADDTSGQLVAVQNMATYKDCYYTDALFEAGYTGAIPADTEKKPCTDAQFKEQSTFEGFDFSSVWTMGGNESYPYPELAGMEIISPSQNTTDFAGGNGLYYSPYLISTPLQVDNMRNYSGSFFSLQNDIDLTEYIAGKPNQSFNPIGGESVFAVCLLGNTHKIKGLKQNLNLNDSKGAGLFSYFSGSVINLGMENVNIRSSRDNVWAGAIGGGCYCGVIYQCYSTGNIEAIATSRAYAGGLTGKAIRSRILNSCNLTTVNSKNSTVDFSGGITGEADHSGITNCMNAGELWSAECAGGIAGISNSGSSTTSYNTGLIHAPRSSGGICGPSYLTVSNCYFLDNIPRLSEDITGTSYARSSNQLRQQSSYAGFDFDNVWVIKPESPYPYAQLKSLNMPVSVTDNPDFSGGDGTSYAPFQVTTAIQMKKVKDYPDASFELKNDIDLNMEAWTPAGSSAVPFSGSFDGKGHTITGMNVQIGSGTSVYAGLFGYVTGTVKNISISDATISASGNTVYAGILCGYMKNAYCKNCETSGSLILGSGIVYGGGLTGFGEQTQIEASWNKAAIQSANCTKSYIGGIAGSQTLITYFINCMNSGSITNTNTGQYHYSGGIIGNAAGSSTIKTCYNSGIITAQTGQENYAGGVTGYRSSGTVENSFYLDNIEKGVGYGNLTGTTKKTDAQMRLQSTYTGFDFNSVWMIGYDPDFAYPKLIALEDAPVLKVSFDLNGMGSPVPAPQNVTWRGKAIRPADPVKTGYAFEGWYKEQGCENAWDFDTDTVTANTTLYAKWRQITYTITFNSMDGTAVETQNTTYGLKVIEPEEPTKPGLLLCGWYKEEACINIWDFTKDTVTADMTLYAMWSENGTPFPGSGTAEEPYRISTPAQLNEVRRYSSANYILTNDIDMNAATAEGGIFYNGGSGWLPVPTFSGVFDGAGYKIIGLKMHRPESDYIGLFDQVLSGGVVRQLGMVNSDIYGGDEKSGSICARNYGTIELCYNTGKVTGSNVGSTGGISGVVYSGGQIAKCYNAGVIDVYQTTSSGASSFGGIAGSGSGISDCYNIGIVKGQGEVGGIVGSGSLQVRNCYSVMSTGYGLIGDALTYNLDENGLYYFQTCDYKIGGLDSSYDVECGVGLTNDEMQQSDSFDGYDFDTVWTMDGDSSYPYPEIQGLPQIDLPENTAEFAGGNGYPYSPFEIETPEELNNVRNYPWASFQLISDIDMSAATSERGVYFNNGQGFAPIPGFYGVFNGNGFNIKGLNISRGDNDAALFDSARYALIIDLGLIDARIQGNNAGGILSYGYGVEIVYCHVDGNISPYDYYGDAGGIAGSLYHGGIFYCRNTALVDGYGQALGGVLGESQYTQVSKCYNTGMIVARDNNGHAGGIVGRNVNYGIIEDCYNAGQIESFMTEGQAGIASDNGSQIINCYNVGIAKNPITDSSTGSNVTNCFYFDDGSSPKPGTTAITDEQLQQQDTYTGFDFDEIWTMTGNTLYPYAELNDCAHQLLREGGVAFEGGNGTEGDPFQISYPAQLNEIRYYPDKHFILLNDIDMSDATSSNGKYYNSGHGWEPISYFAGCIDGDNHEITGLNMNHPDLDNVGFIGQLLLGGVIENLTISDATINAEYSVGSFAGLNYKGTIINCVNNASVSVNDTYTTYDEYAGGIVGINRSDIANCTNNGYVSANKQTKLTPEGRAGGITGNNLAHITNCTNNGLVEAYYPADSLAGGITAKNGGDIEHCTNIGNITSQGQTAGIATENDMHTILQYCTNSGNVTGTDNLSKCGGIAASIATGTQLNHCINKGNISGTREVGGIFGYVGVLGSENYAVQYCYNSGEVTASYYSAGGIAGYLNGVNVSNCFNSGSISSAGDYAGGIAGNSFYGNISKSFNTGDIHAKNYTGGIVGETNRTVCECYSIGNITSAGFFGGIIGIIDSGGAMHDCYYTNADRAAAGKQDSSYTNVAKKTYPEFKQQALFPGFDFSGTWDMIDGERLPTLKGIDCVFSSGIALDRDTLNMTFGQSASLTTTITPENTLFKQVYWTTADPSVATVADGVITATGFGTTTITAFVLDGDFCDSCTVTVDPIHVTSVTLKHNGAEIGSGGIALPEDQTKTLTASVLPANATYPQAAWQSSNEQIVKVDQNGKLTPGGETGSANITATADGASGTCLVTVVESFKQVSFNTNDGSSIAQKDVRYNTCLIRPEDPLKTGYTLENWYKESSCINVWNFNDKIRSNLTLYAKWTANTYTVAYNANGGTGTMTSSSHTYGTSKALSLNEFTRTGYTFAGWAIIPTGEVKYNDAQSVMNLTNANGAEVTLYAVWTQNNCLLSVSANNAAYGTVTGGGTYNQGATVTLTAAANAGYRFVRWSADGSTVSTSASFTFTVSADVSLTAEFTPLTPAAISCSKADNTVYGGASGSITVSASGGDSGTYEYSLNGGPWQSSNTFGGLGAGTYTAAVRDAGYTVNTASCSVSIGQPALSGNVPASKVPSKANAGTAVALTPPPVPRSYTMVSVTYSSTNSAVATVDASGNVTFLAGGKATIITKVVSQMTDSKGRVKTKTSTIKKNITVNQPVATISLNLTDTTIARKAKVKLTASFDPITASNKKVTWKSSNPKVASVSSSGMVVGKTGGTTVITCTAKDGSGALASCTVTVTPIYPASVKLSKAALSVKLGGTASLKANVAPSTTDFKTVTWVSSNLAVVSVDAKGKIKALASGTAVITATTSNGLTASCTVTVP